MELEAYGKAANVFQTLSYLCESAGILSFRSIFKNSNNFTFMILSNFQQLAFGKRLLHQNYEHD